MVSYDTWLIEDDGLARPYYWHVGDIPREIFMMRNEIYDMTDRVQALVERKAYEITHDSNRE